MEDRSRDILIGTFHGQAAIYNWLVENGVKIAPYRAIFIDPNPEPEFRSQDLAHLWQFVDHNWKVVLVSPLNI
jgi:hypothetical protein